MSLTAEPPRIIIAVNRSASAYDRLMANRSFCVNTLHNAQFPLAKRFSGSIKGEERFAEGAWTTWATGAPVLEGAVVNLDCEIAETLEASTHMVIVGDVVEARQDPAGRPLLYVDGDWATLVSATSEDVSRMLAGIDRASMALDAARASEEEPIHQLYRFVREWTKILISHRDLTTRFMGAELYVTPTALAMVNEAEREFNDKIDKLLSRGRADGHFEISESRLTAFAIAGLTAWVARWYRANGRLSEDEVGDLLAHLVLKLVEVRK